MSGSHRGLAVLLVAAVIAAACSSQAESAAPVGPTSAAPPAPQTGPSAPLVTTPPAAVAKSHQIQELEANTVALEAEVEGLRREIAWRDDLQTLVNQMERIHPDPYWRITEAEFDGRLAFLLSDLPEMSDDEVTVDVVRLMATIDGHSGLFSWTLGWDLAHIQFYKFAEGVTVVRSEDPDLVGARLVAIGDTPVDEAWELAAELSPHDNPSTVELITSAHLINPRVLAALGVIATPGDLIYRLELSDGTAIAHTPTVSSREDRADTFGGGLAGLPQSGLAPYLERSDEPFWWTRFADGTTYAQYNAVLTTNFDLEGLAVSVEEGNGRLIVDLRHNGGGNNNTYRALLGYLEERFGDRCGLFVIIGRTTFSAATNFATEVENLTRAVYVGEPTGGSPNLYGDTQSVRLPNSGHIVRVSAMYWEFGGPQDRRVWIEPDIAVAPTASDYFAGRDAALEAAVAAPLCGE